MIDYVLNFLTFIDYKTNLEYSSISYIKFMIQDVFIYHNFFLRHIDLLFDIGVTLTLFSPI